MHMHNRTSCISILYLNFLRSYLTFNFLSFFLCCRCLFFSFIIACAPESTTQSLPQPTSSVACLNCNSRSNPSSHYVFCFSALIYSWHVWRSTKFHVVRTSKNAHVSNTMREIEIVQFSRGWNCFFDVFSVDAKLVLHSQDVRYRSSFLAFFLVWCVIFSQHTTSLACSKLKSFVSTTEQKKSDKIKLEALQGAFKHISAFFTFNNQKQDTANVKEDTDDADDDDDNGIAWITIKFLTLYGAPYWWQSVYMHNVLHSNVNCKFGKGLDGGRTDAFHTTHCYEWGMRKEKKHIPTTQILHELINPDERRVHVKGETIKNI